jgi:hypothetical protein
MRLEPRTPDGKSGILFHTSGATVHEIRFSGLEPICDLAAASTLTIDGTISSDVINVVTGTSCGGDPDYQVNFEGAGELINFRNKTSLTVQALGGSDLVTLDLPARVDTSLTSITLNAGDGVDTVVVKNAPADVFVTAFGDNGDDTLSVWATAATSQLQLYGGDGNDVFSIGSAANVVSDILGTVEFNGGANAFAPTSSLSVSANGNTFSQTLPVGDVLDFNDQGMAAGSLTYDLGSSLVNRGSVGRVTPYTALETINLNAGQGAGTVTVTGTAAVGTTSLTTQSGADSISVTATGANSILSIMTGAGADSVDISNTGSSSVRVVSGGDDSDTLTLVACGVAGVALNGEAGADVINARTTTTGSALRASGGESSDAFNPGSTANSLAALDGQLEVHGDGHDSVPTMTLTIGGSSNTLPSGDQLGLNDQGDAGSYTATLTATSFARGGMNGSVSYDTVETLDFHTSAGTTLVDVGGTANSVNTLIHAQAANDTVVVTAIGAGSNVTANAGSGNDTVSVAGVAGFLATDGGANADVLDHQGTPGALFPTSSTDGYIVPPSGRVGYTSFEGVGGNLQLDFGDAPDPAYPTLLSTDGARHAGDGTLRLGAVWDGELEGQPGASAAGDGSDEDGITFTSVIEVGPDSTGADLDVVSSASGELDAWIDFNADGDFDDFGEQIFIGEPVSGTVSTWFTSFADSLPGETFGRFRLSASGGLAAIGLAADGEVEDYALTLTPPFDLDLFNRVDTGPRSFWACNAISAGDPSGCGVVAGIVTFNAGVLVALRNGFSVAAGAGFSVVLGSVPGCTP